MTRRQILDQMGGANPQPDADGGLRDMTLARLRDPPHSVLSVCFVIHILLILTLVSFVFHFLRGNGRTAWGYLGAIASLMR